MHDPPIPETEVGQEALAEEYINEGVSFGRVQEILAMQPPVKLITPLTHVMETIDALLNKGVLQTGKQISLCRIDDRHTAE